MYYDLAYIAYGGVLRRSGSGQTSNMDPSCPKGPRALSSGKSHKGRWRACLRHCSNRQFRTLLRSGQTVGITEVLGGFDIRIAGMVGKPCTGVPCLGETDSIRNGKKFVLKRDSKPYGMPKAGMWDDENEKRLEASPVPWKKLDVLLPLGIISESLSR